MGKGDKKTKRGKIIKKSYGNKRPRKVKSDFVIPEKPVKKVVVKEEEPVKSAPKKTASKKRNLKKNPLKKLLLKKPK